MYFLLFLLLNICSTFTCFASSLTDLQSDQTSQGLSDAELAVIGLSPPSSERTQRIQSESALPQLNPQESLTSSFITYDDESDEQPIASEKPFSITFPITRSSRSKQSVQSIVIPLPSNLDDRTGIIVIEDHDDGSNLDRRTLRAQFFSPTRIKPFRSQPIRENTIRNETETSLNRIAVDSNRRSQLSRTVKKASTEAKAEPSTTSSVVFDDDIAVTTTTFSPESVFRPKTTLPATVKKQNSTTAAKVNHPIVDTMAISLKARQRISKKSKNLRKNIRKTVPKTTTTTTTTTTTETPTTTEFEEEFEDTDNTESTESTTFSAPETTTRTNILKQFISVNERPNIRRKWIANPITTTQRPTTLRPTTTQRPTTTERTTTTQRTTTQERTTTQRQTQRTVPQRRTTPRQPIRRQTTTTTTPSPTTLWTRRWDTTTSAPIEITDPDYELIFVDNSTKTNFDRNSLKLIKQKNKTISSVEKETEVLKPRPPGAPHIPGNFIAGFLPSGRAFNSAHNVPGSAGIDYPTYDKIPFTGFDCKEQMYPGFYADMETGCQVYHSCNGNLRASKHTFLCPNGTIFSQEYLICDWWYNVVCQDSPIYYPLNKEAFSSPIKSNSTKTKTKINNKKNKPKTTTTEFVIRTITTTDLP